jgi:hypothetical protein
MVTDAFFLKNDGKKTVKDGKKSYFYEMTNGYNESWKTQSGYLFS